MNTTYNKLLECIDSLLELDTISRHEYLNLSIPKGALYFPNIIQKHMNECIVLSMGVTGTHLNAIFNLSNESDCGKMIVETKKFDREAGESIYEIRNVCLSPKDIHKLIGHLFAVFHPFHFSIKESE